MADNDGLGTAGVSSQTVLSGSPSDGEVSGGVETGSTPEAGGGSVIPKWTEQVPSEYRERFAQYKSYKEFVAAADEAMKLREVAVVKPGDDASQEDWDRFYGAVGRPESPDGYTIESKDAGEFKAQAHKLGLTDKQAKDLFHWYSDGVSQGQKAETEKVVSTLKNDWGDTYEQNMKAIERFKTRYGTPELAKELSNPVVGNNVHLIKALAQAGMDLAPEALVEGSVVPNVRDEAPHFTYSNMKDMYPQKDIRRRA